MRKIEICLTPDLLFLHSLEGKIVVVVDILRATSCMVTAFAHKVEKIIPVATVEECKQLQQQGLIAAAERGGEKVEGFDIGNSPFSYTENSYAGHTIAMTTTNGTQAIVASQKAETIVIGAFLNINTVAQYLVSKDNDVVVVCAGWQGNINMEDTLFAGALAQILVGTHTWENDACYLATTAHEVAKNDYMLYLKECSHFKRLMRFGLEQDVRFCLKHDVYDVLPYMKEGYLTIKKP
ncbi:MAG: 2-phosphosulfolactate phosphatase [Cytophagales bacterium]|nr:MAG: 2-phosphosulfolactate phosphatase [Cytophagales bacterium]